MRLRGPLDDAEIPAKFDAGDPFDAAGAESEPQNQCQKGWDEDAAPSQGASILGGARL